MIFDHFGVPITIIKPAMLHFKSELTGGEFTGGEKKTNKKQNQERAKEKTELERTQNKTE